MTGLVKWPKLLFDKPIPIIKWIFGGGMFGRGEDGGVYLQPNAGSYFADTAGTTPADLTDAIALVKGEVGPDWTQGTATARPVWAREPEGGRRNLLLQSQNFEVATWAKANVAITTNAEVSPSGATDAALLVPNTANATHLISQSVGFTAAVRTYTVYAKPAGYNTVFIRAFDGTAFFGALFNMSTGVVDSSTAGVSAAIDPVADGWYRCSISFTPLPGSGFVYIYPNTVNGFTGDGTSGIYIWGAQLETGSTPTPYQRVTTAADVTEAGVPDVPYLRFDLADDVLTTTLAAGTYTVALPTRQGIWIDEVVHAGGSFSVGPTSYTGGPAGILTALESDGVSKLIAPPLVIDRALSAGERNGLVRWYQSRGAGVELEVLP